MIRFNWQKFCDRHRIPYVTRGPNTARNHISIRCPLCGVADPSEHMGLSLDTRDPKWGCFRNPTHRGRDPTFLVRAILRCSPEVARHEVDALRPETDAFDEAVQQLLRPAKSEAPFERRHAVLQLPKEFKKLESSSPSSWVEKHFRYLRKRGFEEAEELAYQYDLRYCLVGRFRYRLIIPIVNDFELVGWTGRAIDPRRKPRYLTLSQEEGALYNADEFVWRRDQVRRSHDTLIIVEGPMDAIKMEWCLHTAHRRFDGVVTCLFGMPKQKQVDFLQSVAKRYERILVMLDREAYAQSLRLALQLSEFGGKCFVPQLPAKDPGMMTTEQILTTVYEESVMA